MSERGGFLEASAPPERLAAFRILLGLFTLGYLLIRLPVFLQLRHRSASSFDGVGIFAPLSRPLPSGVVVALVVVAVVCGACFTLGMWFRISGPAFAVAMLILASYRSSWGQLLHFENLFVLHLLVVGCAPSADAWSIDVRRSPAHVHRPGSSTRYGWPLQLACLIVTVTYLIAGIAKLRYGGLEWMIGDTLRNHVAYSAVRLDLLGGTPSPLASVAVQHAWIFPPMAVGSVVLEIAAPLALLGSRYRDVWVGCAWIMHVTIFALMLVGFPYPLFLVAFTPFFRLERLSGLRSTATG